MIFSGPGNVQAMAKGSPNPVASACQLLRMLFLTRLCHTHVAPVSDVKVLRHWVEGNIGARTFGVMVRTGHANASRVEAPAGDG